MRIRIWKGKAKDVFVQIKAEALAEQRKANERIQIETTEITPRVWEVWLEMKYEEWRN